MSDANLEDDFVWGTREIGVGERDKHQGAKWPADFSAASKAVQFQNCRGGPSSASSGASDRHLPTGSLLRALMLIRQAGSPQVA
jgi:hypothetical protein